MNTLRPLVTLLTFAFVAAAGLSAAAQDKIIWKGERAPIEGTVVSINFLNIKYRMAGSSSEQEEDAREVRNIEFDSQNPSLPNYEFDQGRRALNKGLQKEAVEQFTRAIDRIKGSNTPNHPMRDFCRKHILEAHLAAGDTDSVVKAARELRREKADSFFLRDSFLMQYEAAKAKRDPALLNETIKELEEVVRSDRRYQDLERDASLLRADVLETNKQHDKALDMYRKLSGNPEMWEDVTLGTLRCLSALGRKVDLKAKVESLLVELKEKRDSNPRVYLGAVIGRGDVNLAEGNLKEALLDYLKAALDPGQAANTYEHETAIAKAALASARYGKQFGEKDKTNKMLYIDRAREMREELKRTFPSSAWMTDIDAAVKDAERSQ